MGEVVAGQRGCCNQIWLVFVFWPVYFMPCVFSSPPMNVLCALKAKQLLHCLSY